MWVLGGTNPNQDFNDVWFSSDGLNWTAATLSAPWTPRCCHSVVAFDNKMWVMGGSNNHGTPTDKNDVWYSSDGVNWTLATASAWSYGRQAHTSIVFNGKIWVLGGYRVSGVHLNDVWSSSDGTHWTLVTSSAAWGPRASHTTVLLGCNMYVLGGQFDRNDVWTSSDGLNWTQVDPSADWAGRDAHASVIFHNKLWVMGGFRAGGIPAVDVWLSDSLAFGTRHIVADSGLQLPRNPQVGDIDGDDIPDIVGVDSTQNGGMVLWWKNINMDGSTWAPNVIEGGGFGDADYAIPADIDHDGDLDVVAIAITGNEIAWWQNNGSGWFSTKNSIVPIS